MAKNDGPFKMCNDQRTQSNQGQRSYRLENKLGHFYKWGTPIGLPKPNSIHASSGTAKDHLL